MRPVKTQAQLHLQETARAFMQGQPRPLERLLENYALWVKTQTGVPGYHGPLSGTSSPNFDRELAKPETTLSDDEGLLIDAAVSRARAVFPLGWLVFQFYYFRGYNLREIAQHRAFYRYARALAREYGALLQDRNPCTKTMEIFYTRVYTRFLIEIAHNF